MTSQVEQAVDHLDMHGYDTVVQCRKCGKKQWLDFVNGLKYGWSECCGETMPILEHHADIERAVKQIVEEAKDCAESS